MWCSAADPLLSELALLTGTPLVGAGRSRRQGLPGARQGTKVLVRPVPSITSAVTGWLKALGLGFSRLFCSTALRFQTRPLDASLPNVQRRFQPPPTARRCAVATPG